MRELPSDLLILGRFGVSYQHMRAAWQTGEKLGISPKDVLINTGIITPLLWQDAQTLLQEERRIAYETVTQNRILLDQAINNLDRNLPQYSARKTFHTSQLIRYSGQLILLLSAFYLAFEITLTILFVLISFFYTGVMVLRLLVLSRFRTTKPDDAQTTVFNDDQLPTYTLLVALYKEASQIKDLTTHLHNLDWPRDKLDIKLVCEADDRTTIAEIKRLRLPKCFELVVVPNAAPKTKPKALNFALPLARGDFTVLYDAEDRPVPNQLKEAYAKFSKGNPRLACVQAPLLIHNSHQTWLTSFFAIEYYTLFKGLLPVFAKWRIPIPLGGTSNHFRTSILKDIGAWDPFNVTEDADLGIRIHREGYYTTTISAPTYEEAPPVFNIWLKQRTRWVKGWMQTLLIHNRHPIAFIREIGLWHTLAYHLVLTSVVMSILLHPVLIGMFAWNLVNFHTSSPSNTDVILLITSAFNLVGGYSTYGLLAYAVLNSVGETLLIRRIIFLPIYWIIISVAGFRAVYQLIVSPHYWEKTPHGLASSTFCITDGSSNKDFENASHES